MSTTTTPAYTYQVCASEPEMIERSDGLVFPAVAGNANFIAYMQWLQAGNKRQVIAPSVSVANAEALLAGGLAVISNSTASLNGTYRTDGIAMQGIQAEANALMLGGTTPVFADGSSSLTWPDKSGIAHTFTPTQFLALIHSINYFVSQCAQYAAGILTTAPNNTATIA